MVSNVSALESQHLMQLKIFRFHFPYCHPLKLCFCLFEYEEMVAVPSQGC